MLSEYGSTPLRWMTRNNAWWKRSLSAVMILAVSLPMLSGCQPAGGGDGGDKGDGKASAGAKEPGGGVGQALPAVIVTSPIEREIVDSRVFPNARVQATDMVEVRSRVSGYLTKILFQSGAEVKAGTPLFEIDPSTYQAVLDRAEAQKLAAEAQVQVYEARITRLKTELDRNESLLLKNSISQQDVDMSRGNYAEAIAGLMAAKADIAAATAAVNSAKLDLEFTDIASPIDGVVSRDLVTQGNLVTAGTTKLTEIVSMDPIHVYFDVDIHAIQQIQAIVASGELQLAPVPESGSAENVSEGFGEDSSLHGQIGRVEVGLPGEDGFSTVGYLDFSEPSVNRTMGVLTMRAVIPNPKVNGVRRYNPGVFASVRIPFGRSYKAILIPEEATGTDQNINFVLVVNDENKVEFRPIVLGRLQPDNMRVVNAYDSQTRSGLKPTDRVITSGLMIARPGNEVVTEYRAYGTLAVDDTAGSEFTLPTKETPVEVNS